MKAKYGTPEYDAEMKRNGDSYRAVEWLRTKMIEMIDEKSQKGRMDIFHDANNVFLNIRNTILQIDAGAYVHFCSKCGRPEMANYMEPTGTRLKKNCLCFSCDFWVERRSLYNSQNRQGSMLVINGDVRSDGGIQPEGQNKAFMGFGGATWYLYQITTGKLWKTNNLWSGGDIPKEFRPGMPDNAVILTKEQFELAEAGRDERS